MLAAVIQVREVLPGGRVVVIDARTGRSRRVVHPASLHPGSHTRVGTLRRTGWVFISPGDHLAEYLDRALPGPEQAGHGWTGVREHTFSCSVAHGGTVILWNREDIGPAIAALAAVAWRGEDITDPGGRPELLVRHRDFDLCPATVREDATRLLCTQPRGHHDEHYVFALRIPPLSDRWT